MNQPPPTDLPPSRRALLRATAGAAALSAGCRSPRDAAMEGAGTATATAEDELDELFADLTDQRGQHEPVTRAEKAARLARLGQILGGQGVDALVLEAGSTLSYLSDVSWGRSERLFALVVLADGGSFWIAPSFEVPRASERIARAGGPAGPIVGWDEHEYAFAPLAAALRERRVERVAIEPQCRAFVAQALAAELGGERVVAGLPVVRALRGRKDAHELALLRAASELTQEAIGAVAERLRPGLTDHEVGAWMRRAQERLGLSGVWVLPLIGDGAAYPHGGPEGRRLTPGDLLLVDTGGGLHGYQSDNTRTWIFDGKPTAEVERGWNTVKEAQEKAFAALRPGRPCREVDQAARAVIERSGFGEGYAAFAHRLGHGIGMDGHEDPYLDGGSEVILEPGMTFSDEPGVYLPGRFGVRLEDIVVVTEEGADHFGAWQRTPLAP